MGLFVIIAGGLLMSIIIAVMFCGCYCTERLCQDNFFDSFPKSLFKNTMGQQESWRIKIRRGWGLVMIWFFAGILIAICLVRRCLGMQVEDNVRLDNNGD